MRSQRAASHTSFSTKSEMDVHSRDLHCRFNSICYIDEQTPFLKQITEYFHQLGRIFQRHQALSNFGITLIHRHIELPERCAIVHLYQAPDKDLCLIEPVRSRMLFSRSYHLVDDSFLPYEFVLELTLALSAEFLCELKQFLRGHDLQQIIGVFFVLSDKAL